jgi:hypothetical protein
MDIYNPAQTPSLFPVAMNPIMAWSAECSKVFIPTEPLATAPRLVMDVVAGFVFATLALWMEGKIRILYLGVLVVLLCAFRGCSPQPAISF